MSNVAIFSVGFEGLPTHQYQKWVFSQHGEETDQRFHTMTQATTCKILVLMSRQPLKACTENMATFAIHWQIRQHFDKKSLLTKLAAY
jgi:hypothetical protein